MTDGRWIFSIAPLLTELLQHVIDAIV